MYPWWNISQVKPPVNFGWLLVGWFWWSIGVGPIAADEARVSVCVRQAPGVMASEEAATLLQLHAAPPVPGVLVFGCCVYVLRCWSNALLLCCFPTLLTLNAQSYP